MALSCEYQETRGGALGQAVAMTRDNDEEVPGFSSVLMAILGVNKGIRGRKILTSGAK